MNAIRRLCMHQRNANAFQEAERDKALFSIVKSIVLERKVGPAKASPASAKSNPWSLRFVLRLASRHVNLTSKVYIQTVYSSREKCGIGLPSKLERRAEATRNAETAPVTASVLRQFQ
jgi:hypothetical protein